MDNQALSCASVGQGRMAVVVSAPQVMPAPSPASGLHEVDRQVGHSRDTPGAKAQVLDTARHGRHGVRDYTRKAAAGFEGLKR
jgi:hypothetical protein